MLSFAVIANSYIRITLENFISWATQKACFNNQAIKDTHWPRPAMTRNKFEKVGVLWPFKIIFFIVLLRETWKKVELFPLGKKSNLAEKKIQLPNFMTNINVNSNFDAL